MSSPTGDSNAFRRKSVLLFTSSSADSPARGVRSLSERLADQIATPVEIDAQNFLQPLDARGVARLTDIRIGDEAASIREFSWPVDDPPGFVRRVAANVWLLSLLLTPPLYRANGIYEQRKIDPHHAMRVWRRTLSVTLLDHFASLPLLALSTVIPRLRKRPWFERYAYAWDLRQHVLPQKRNPVADRPSPAVVRAHRTVRESSPEHVVASGVGALVAEDAIARLPAEKRPTLVAIDSPRDELRTFCPWMVSDDRFPGQRPEWSQAHPSWTDPTTMATVAKFVLPIAPGIKLRSDSTDKTGGMLESFKLAMQRQWPWLRPLAALAGLSLTAWIVIETTRLGLDIVHEWIDTTGLRVVWARLDWLDLTTAWLSTLLRRDSLASFYGLVVGAFAAMTLTGLLIAWNDSRRQRKRLE